MDSTFKIRKISVLGAGTMGRAIARLFSEKGIQTILYDSDKQVNDKISAENWLNENLVLQYDLKTAVFESDLIIESAPEILEVKRNIFFNISPFLTPTAIVASNTSSYPLQILSEGLSFSSRLILMHFFNPADLIPLIELVKPEEMPNEALADLIALLEACEKKPILLKRDIKGFIANRLQAALLREACNLLQQGVADVGDIDAAVKHSIGLRWALNGPFEITDLGGLDIWEKVLMNILPDLDNTTGGSPIINKLVNNNNLGVKTNRGFYEYRQSASIQAVLQREKLVRLLKNINEK